MPMQMKFTAAALLQTGRSPLTAVRGGGDTIGSFVFTWLFLLKRRSSAVTVNPFPPSDFEKQQEDNHHWFVHHSLPSPAIHCAPCGVRSPPSPTHVRPHVNVLATHKSHNFSQRTVHGKAQLHLGPLRGRPRAVGWERRRGSGVHVGVHARRQPIGLSGPVRGFHRDSNVAQPPGRGKRNAPPGSVGSSRGR